jgi:WD40 repeat protein
VTGTTKGEIAVWDFESSTLLAFLIKHTDAVTEILFLNPYPLIVTTGADGLICMWSIKPFKCLYIFLNKSVKVE